MVKNYAIAVYDGFDYNIFYFSTVDDAIKFATDNFIINYKIVNINTIIKSLP